MVPGSLPYDLSVWMDKCALVKLTLEVTTEFAGLVSRRAPASPAPDGFPPAMLLTLLTYCYATGAFTSSEIERRTYEDDIVRYLATHHHPDQASLRAFRRRWRQVIKECLLNLLALLWQHRYPAAASEARDGTPLTPVQRNPDVSPELVRLWVCEAERRIDRAVQWDSIELDD